MLSTEFTRFYYSWIRKANEYETQELQQCFDKFFTLFVIYNRLYAEATFQLVRRGEITLQRRRRIFPDSLAAKKFVRKYVGSQNLVHQLEEDMQVNQAINTVIRLVDEQVFFIKLDVMTGNRQREAGSSLLNSLRSVDKITKVKAILDFIYSIRCNMFHGHKGFNEIQCVYYHFQSNSNG